ncbi:hypothetical protein Tco_0568963 [Tanacetum coccineum]
MKLKTILLASFVTALRIPINQEGYNKNQLLLRDNLSAPKTYNVVMQVRNNKKALNILLTQLQIDNSLEHFLMLKCSEFVDGYKSIIRIGAREELDSAYDRFQNIISMLELYDAKVSCEDANLKFLRSLPPVWHVVATMIRGQPGLDELDFDDLYNNLKVYEHQDNLD